MNNPQPKAGQELEVDGVPGDTTPALSTPEQDTGLCPSYARKSAEICPLPAFVTREMSPSC